MKTLKELLEEYDKTDSIKKQQELEELIVRVCEKYITALDKIASKYDVQVIDDSDYQSDRGYWGFDDDSFVILKPAGNHEVRLTYRDSWRYGGYCEIGHYFYADEVDNFDPIKFEKECRKVKCSKLEREVSAQKKELKKAEDLLAKFKEQMVDSE